MWWSASSSNFYATGSLRLEDMCGAKIRPPLCRFPSIIQLLNHLLKIWGTTFWPSGQWCQKYVYIWKVTSIVSELKLKVWYPKSLNSTILNFSPAPKGHLENVNTLLTPLGTWSKSCPSYLGKMEIYWFLLEVIQWWMNQIETTKLSIHMSKGSRGGYWLYKN